MNFGKVAPIGAVAGSSALAGCAMPGPGASDSSCGQVRGGQTVLLGIVGSVREV